MFFWLILQNRFHSLTRECTNCLLTATILKPDWKDVDSSQCAMSHSQGDGQQGVCRITGRKAGSARNSTTIVLGLETELSNQYMSIQTVWVWEKTAFPFTPMCEEDRNPKCHYNCLEQVERTFHPAKFFCFYFRVHISIISDVIHVSPLILDSTIVLFPEDAFPNPLATFH